MEDSNQDPNRITFLGNIDYRNKMVKFGIKAQDRTRHTYVIGKSGMGKSTLLENMAIQDIQNGEGLAFLDPHGGSAEKLLDFIPEHRKKDVIYFAPFDLDYPIALNILEKVDLAKRHLVANGLMAAFKKVFGEEKFSDRMQNILNNIILTLLENEGETLMGVNRMLSDKEYRKKMVSQVQDPSVKSFWTEEFANAGSKYQQEAAPAIQNKIGQYTSNPLIRNIVGQKKTSFDIREIMDKQKILIINLSKGKVGEGNANLLGSLLITKIYLAAMSRADASAKDLAKLPPFYFYVDEFQNFANESFADILSEARKYNLALTVAHQYIEQMSEEVKAAIFGNIGTMIAFRVGAHDAEVFEKEFAPVFTADDIVNLSAFQIYLRLMIDNVSSKPFSAIALPPILEPESSWREEILDYSRAQYGKPKIAVEKEVRDWYAPILQERLESSNLENRNSKPIFKERSFEVRNLAREENFESKNRAYSSQEKETPKPNFTSQNQNDFRKEFRTHTRSRNYKEETKKGKDILDVELTKLRKDTERLKTESVAEHTSLKEALAKAIRVEGGQIKSLQNEQLAKKLEKETELPKVEVKDIMENKKREDLREKLREIPEKVLRDLVEE